MSQHFRPTINGNPQDLRKLWIKPRVRGSSDLRGNKIPKRKEEIPHNPMYLEFLQKYSQTTIGVDYTCGI
jgi:hypothetical protein